MMRKGFLVSVFLLITVQVFSQDLGGIDFENLRSDDLSDQQVTSLYERAQSEGYSVDEVAALATARGMDSSEVSKLRSRLNQLRSGSGQQAAEDSIDSSEERLRDSPDDTQENRVSTMSVSEPEQRIFGSSLFTSNNLTFEPSQNIPTPQNYELGPGDELIIDIWGATSNNYQLTISPEGSISFDNLGPVYISGLTIEEASELIIDRLSSIYAGIKGERKDTFVQVSLGRVRSIKVSIVGEVRTPGTYSISSLSTVFNALYTSGGPSRNGTYRAIRVLRNNEIVEEVDLYDFLVYGDQSSNIRLRDQDIIQVGTYKNRISLNGETKRTGLFETLDGETFGDLLDYAGGFNQQAYKGQIKIRRNTDIEKEIIQLDFPEESDTILQSGDEISVGRILDRYSNRVEIQGAVYREGEYQLEEAPTLYSLIENAQGLRGDAFMERAIIYRTLPDLSVEVLSVDLAELMNNPEEENIELVKDDIVQISSIFDLQEDYTVSINGEINSGGSFPYRKDLTIKELILMSDGFTESAAEYNIEVARRVADDSTGQVRNNIAEIYQLEITDKLLVSNPDTDFQLKPFDQVYVRRSPSYVEQQSVRITGQVTFPGTYVIDDRDFTISDLVEKAGGLTPFAYAEGASLSRQFSNLEQGNATSDEFETLSNQVQLDALRKVGIDLPTILSEPKSNQDLKLVPGDVLEVPTMMQTVNVQGEVLFPINVRYDDKKNLRDYISNAGGFSDRAKRHKVYVRYANGDLDRTKRFLFFKSYPEIKPGSMIYVPQKEEEVEMSPQERIAILSAIVSMAAIVTNTIFQIRR